MNQTPYKEPFIIRKALSHEITDNESVEVLSYAPHFVNRGTWSVKINNVLIDVGGQWQEPSPRETPIHETYQISFETDYTGTDVANAVSDAKEGKFLQIFTYKKYAINHESDI